MQQQQQQQPYAHNSSTEQQNVQQQQQHTSPSINENTDTGEYDKNTTYTSNQNNISTKSGDNKGLSTTTALPLMQPCYQDTTANQVDHSITLSVKLIQQKFDNIQTHLFRFAVQNVLQRVIIFIIIFAVQLAPHGKMISLLPF